MTAPGERIRADRQRKVNFNFMICMISAVCR
jgi:hypothetical protein